MGVLASFEILGEEPLKNSLGPISPGGMVRRKVMPSPVRIMPSDRTSRSHPAAPRIR
jgi:hypothetical protein